MNCDILPNSDGYFENNTKNASDNVLYSYSENNSSIELSNSTYINDNENGTNSDNFDIDTRFIIRAQCNGIEDSQGRCRKVFSSGSSGLKVELILISYNLIILYLKSKI